MADNEEAHEGFINRMAEELSTKFNTARAKYDPIVPRLSDIEFAALWIVVSEERGRRLARLVATNPLVRDEILRSIRLREQSPLPRFRRRSVRRLRGADAMNDSTTRAWANVSVAEAAWHHTNVAYKTAYKVLRAAVVRETQGPSILIAYLDALAARDARDDARRGYADARAVYDAAYRAQDETT